MTQNAELVIYDQGGLYGNDLKTLILPPAGGRGWEPLDLEWILQMFHEAAAARDIAAYIEHTPKNENERSLVFFLDSLRRGSYNTVKLYARYIVGLLNYCRKPFHRVNYVDVRDYLQSFTEAERKDRTLNVVLASLKSFYKMMHGSGVCPVNPTALVKMQKVHDTERMAQQTVIRAVQEPELVSHKRYLREKSPLRDLLIVTVMSSMGLRASEICNLFWKDFFFAQDRNAYVLYILGKGKKHRMLAIPQGTLNLIRQYLEYEFLVTGQDIPLAIKNLPMFPLLHDKTKPMTGQAVYRMVSRLCERAGQPHRSPHSYRHHFISKAAMLKVPLDQLQRAAGHDDIRTTNIYVEAGEIFSSATTEVFKDSDKF